MYDMVFVGPKSERYNNLKQKYAMLKHAKDVDMARSLSMTKMLWIIWDDVQVCDDFDFEFEADQWSQDVVHIFKNDNIFDGIILVPKSVTITEEEIKHRIFSKKKEVAIIASTPISFDVFEINSYDDYTHALENSSTEMFWMTSNNLKIDNNLVNSFYISHHDIVDRKQNHAFIHRVDDTDYYNGVFLCSKHASLSKREVEYRFPVNRKEWNIVASGPVEYDIFNIDSYDDYTHALENSKTEMFWMVPSDVTVCSDFTFNLYFNFDNSYDRKTNHVFLNNNEYDGIVLCSKQSPINKREINHRFIVNAKKWDIVASNPKPYDLFYVETWEEYEHAFENSSTEMFWAVSHNLKYDQTYINNFYFSHHNSYDRNENHSFVHSVGDKKLHNGVFLCSKNKPLNKKQIEYRFLVNAKQWDDVVSGPTQYDIFEVDTYKEYLDILKLYNKEMFWIVPTHVDPCKDFKFDLYFSHDNEYDRKINHVFKNDKYYDGIILCSKHSAISQREFEHKFLVTNKKEHDIQASTPRPYEVFHVSTYNEYINAKETSKFDLFWLTFDDINVQDDFKFDMYFPHYDTYNRNINHVFKNGKYYDGVILASKNEKISEREFLFRFLARKKEQDTLASMPAPYDVVFISYQEPNADENYRLLKEKVPNAKRVHGVKGIHQAHIEAAKQCTTPMFYIVDGDALIMDDFNFDHQVAAWQYDHVFVWRSQNPINDMVYGYGGLKLFPTQLTIDMDTTKPDMTTSISKKFNAMPNIANITAFNTGAFETWKSAFRECAKLSSKVIDRQKEDETNERLKIWTTVGHDRPFGEHAIRGARAGMQYGLSNGTDLRLINDFDWLKEQFDANI
jgi:hypothetical protein